MRNRPDGFVVAETGNETTVDDLEDASFTFDGSIGALIEKATHVPVPLRRARFSGTFSSGTWELMRLAGTHNYILTGGLVSPSGQVGSTIQLGHELATATRTATFQTFL